MIKNKYIRNLIHHLRVFYYLSMDHERFPDIVWKRLKLYHIEGNVNSGVFEVDKRVESYFNLTDDVSAHFFYEVKEGKFKCTCRVLESFDSEMATELFILATHFNNMLRHGKVIVHPENQFVDYLFELDLAMIILYPGELHQGTAFHFRLSKDVHWAYSKLLLEGEEPAIIIADLIRIKDESKNNEQ